MNMTLAPSEDYLVDFYGPSSRWFGITVGSISAFVICSNSFFLAITLSSKELRSKSSNWFLIGFSISDFIHGSSHIFDAYAILYGSIENRHLCSLAGMFVLLAATSSFGFPFLIAADRYYNVIIPQNEKRSLGEILFTKRYAIPLMIGWYLISLTGGTTLFFFNAFGEDPAGFCGAKKFTDVRLLLIFVLAVCSVLFIALSLAGIYYYRLTKWLKQNQNSTNVTGMKHTRELMAVMKVIIIIPLTLSGPGIALTAGQMILPEMSMVAKRIIETPYLMASAANPWLTIILLRPFRRRILNLLSKFIPVSARGSTIAPQATNTAAIRSRLVVKVIS